MSETESAAGRRRKDDPLGVGVDTPTLVAIGLGVIGSVGTANLVMGDPIGRWIRGMQDQQAQQQQMLLQQQEAQRQQQLAYQQQYAAQNGHNHPPEQYYYGPEQPPPNPYGGNPYMQQPPPAQGSPPPDPRDHVGENSINIQTPSPSQEYLADPTVAEYVQRSIAGGQNIPLQGSYTYGVKDKAGVRQGNG